MLFATDALVQKERFESRSEKVAWPKRASASPA